jgi:hypothetical protein
VLGAQAPSNQITVGAIGVGRISRGHDLPGIWRHPQARIMAACDLDPLGADLVEQPLALIGLVVLDCTKPRDQSHGRSPPVVAVVFMSSSSASAGTRTLPPNVTLPISPSRHSL